MGMRVGMRKRIIGIGIGAAAAVIIAAGLVFAQGSGGAANNSGTPWLGVSITTSGNQVVIVQVQPGSPAASANLLAGDVIVAFDGTPIATPTDLINAVQSATVGATAQIDLLRNGSPVTVSFTLTGAPSAPQTGSLNPGSFGLHPLSVASRLLQAQLTEVSAGYQVTSLSTSANPFTLEVGDVVTTIDGQNVKQLDMNALQNSLAGQALPQLSIDVVRNGATITLTGAPPVGSLVTGRGGDDGGFGGEGGFRLANPLTLAGSILQAQLTPIATGYQVTALGTAANPFNLQLGDVVTTLDGQAVTSLDLNTLRSDLAGQALPQLTLQVIRNNVTITLTGTASVGALAFGRGGDDGGFGFGGDGGLGNGNLGVLPGNGSALPQVTPQFSGSQT